MYKLDSDGAINITAYRATSSWNSSSITWNNKPNYTTSNNSGLATYLGSNWYGMDVTYWIDSFYNGAHDYGFCIKDSNESSTSVWATFASSDYSGSTYDPRLEVYYHIPPTRLFYNDSGGPPIPSNIPTIRIYFENGGYDAYSYFCNSASTVRSYIGDSKIVHIEGHGGGGVIQCTDTTYLTATGSSTGHYPLSTSYAASGLPDCKFICFAGCDTADYSATYGDLDDYAYYTLGVDATLAFEDHLSFTTGDPSWGLPLFCLDLYDNMLNEADNLYDAIQGALVRVYNRDEWYCGLDSYVVRGGTITLYQP